MTGYGRRARTGETCGLGEEIFSRELNSDILKGRIYSVFFFRGQSTESLISPASERDKLAICSWGERERQRGIKRGGGLEKERERERETGRE